MTRIVRWLASARVAVTLIVILMVLTVLNVLLPQKTYFPAADFAEFQSASPELARVLSALGLDAVFGGWLIAAFTILLCASVAACTWLRISRRRASSRVPLRSETGPLASSWSDRPNELLDSIKERLTSEGWTVETVPTGVVATKRGAGFWGSIVLHVSILVLALGGALASLTSFTGTLVIAEGQSLIDDPAAYLTVTREPRIGAAFTGAQLSLERMNVVYQGGSVVTAEAYVSAIDTEGRSVSRRVRVNHPLDVAGKSYLLQDTGFAVDVDLSVDGQEQALVLNLADRTSRGYADSIDVPNGAGGTARIGLELTPVPLTPGASAPPQALIATDPRLEVRLASDEGGASAGTIALARGESLELAPGVTLNFREVRYWSTFLVRSEPARTIVYFGFALAVLGSLVRFISADRRIGVRVVGENGGASLVVGYAARPWGRGYTRDRAEAREFLRLGVEGESS